MKKIAGASQLNIKPDGRRVVLTWACCSEEAAETLADELASQVRGGKLEIEFVGVRETTNVVKLPQ